MKLKNFFPVLLLIVSVSLLTGCAGGAGLVTSWPGVLVEPETNTAYLAYNTFVHAINLDNGAEKWRFPEKAGNGMLFFATPALTSDGQLIVGGYDKILYSLDAATGRQNWVFEGSTSRFVATPVVVGERIFAPSSDSYLYALDLSGKLVWKFKTGHSQWGAPAVNGSTIYLPSMDHRIYALQMSSGELLWKTDDLGGAIAGSPALSEDGVLYVGTMKPEMVALRASNGEVLWRTPAAGWVWGEPTLQDGVLYYGDLSGAMYAVNAADGSIRWQYSPTEEGKKAISGSPLIQGDTVYFLVQSGRLYALDLASGNPRWNKAFEKSQFYAGPFLADNLLLVPQTGVDQLLMALDLNGAPMWTFTPGK
jgi:outer membrane protein assembly factor BamB